MGSFLQTTEWLEFQKSIGRKAWRFDNGKIKANIIRHDLPLGKSYLYIPHGPEFNFENLQAGVSNEIKEFFSYLVKLGKENKSIFIKTEPLTDIVPELIFSSGVKIKKSHKEIQPGRTVILDLDPSEDELLAKMHHKTRYNINLADKKGITVRESGDIKSFWELLRKTAKADSFSTHPFNYYKQLTEFFGADKDLKVKLYMAEYEGRAIAGAVIGIFDGMGYFLHGAMDRDYRNMMPSFLLHWEIIRRLKEQNCSAYDFWGIDADKWPGVTRFKLRFGGRTVERPGAFDLVLSGVWYLIYKIVRKLRD